MIDHGSRSTWGPGPSGSRFCTQKYDLPELKQTFPTTFVFINFFPSLTGTGAVAVAGTGAGAGTVTGTDTGLALGKPLAIELTLALIPALALTPVLFIKTL